MFKNLDFYITPVLNMDGYIYSWRDNSVSFIFLSIPRNLHLIKVKYLHIWYV